MRGFFVSINAQRENFKQPVAYVYQVECSLDDPSQFVTGGTWSPTVMEKHDDYLLIKPTPGYHIRAKALTDNPYFDKFCQSTTCLRNGWKETEWYYPYKVTRRKHDNMFLLLAEGIPTKPVDVTQETLNNVLRGCKIIYK